MGAQHQHIYDKQLHFQSNLKFCFDCAPEEVLFVKKLDFRRTAHRFMEIERFCCGNVCQYDYIPT
jgi:hypothetical protein